MTTAREFLNLLHRFEQFNAATTNPDKLLRELPEDQFRTLVLVLASMFKVVRAEAVRRGIWDDLTRGATPQHHPECDPGVGPAEGNICHPDCPVRAAP